MNPHQLSLATQQPPQDPPKPRAVRSASELTREQNERVRGAIRYLVSAKFDGIEVLLAEAINRDKSSVNKIVSGSKQSSMETARRVAALFSKKLPLGVLLDTNTPFAELDADAARSPALIAVLRRVEGLLPPEVAREMRVREFTGADAFTEREWFRVVIARMLAFEQGEGTTRSVDEEIELFNAKRRKT